LLQKEAITEPSAIATSGNDGQKTSNRVKDEIEEEAEVETVVVAEEADVEADAE
jgi:small subunit ribosomal protein S6